VIALLRLNLALELFRDAQILHQPLLSLEINFRLWKPKPVLTGCNTWIAVI
jgi:hypothetical protein